MATKTTTTRESRRFRFVAAAAAAARLHIWTDCAEAHCQARLSREKRWAEVGGMAGLSPTSPYRDVCDD
ncbi:MAG: hypothetical protein ABI690_23650 [Chloroflexota bacterium]